MDQSLASRAPLALVSPAGPSPAGGSEPGRVRTVFLRIPDCSEKLDSLAVGAGSLPLPATWFERLASVTAGVFKGTWLPPRAWLVVSLGLAAVLTAVALAGPARRLGWGARSADPEPVSARHAATAAVPAKPSITTSGPSVLDDAPAFSPGEQARASANEPAKLDTNRSATSPANKNSATDGRTAPGPTAHLEQRIDRVSTPY